MKLNPMMLCDFYKLSHREMYPDNTEVVYSTWTPRASRIEGIDKVVCFGVSAFVRQWLVEYFNENFFNANIDAICEDYITECAECLGQDVTVDHIRALHTLGYLPLVVKAMPEGELCPIRCPMLTIENTHPEFFWLTNYIETLMSAELWAGMTAATLAFQYRKILTKYARLTANDTSFVPYQGHDFSFRGISSLESAIKTGMGHLTSFVGTDTIPAIKAVKKYYNTSETIGTSVNATEHSIQCAYASDRRYFRAMLNKYKTGIVSIVSDGYDFWDVIKNILPEFKEEILNGNRKVVIRPDSGDPVKIICGDLEANDPYVKAGAIECLYNIFGGEKNGNNCIQLHKNIGLIYGDSITLDRCELICSLLRKKGFASTNVVLGIGSYTYQYNTRDTFGFALKSTYCRIDGEHRQIYKNPKTDDGTKKSQQGKVIVYQKNGQWAWVDSLNSDASTELVTYFENGEQKTSYGMSEIRRRLEEQI